MEKLKTLQRQFETAANQFPGMTHVIAESSKDGIPPAVIPDGLNWSISPNVIFIWGESINRQSDEQGYPASHWMMTETSQTWDKMIAFSKFELLADEAGTILAKIGKSTLKINFSVWSPIELWILAVHQLGRENKWTTVFHRGKKGKTALVRPGRRTEYRLPEKGESYVSVLGDVFFQSALACGELLDRIKVEQAFKAERAFAAATAARAEIEAEHSKSGVVETPSKPPANLMTIKIIPQYFKITARTLYRWIKDGKLKPYPDINGSLRVDATEVAKYAIRQPK